MNKLVMHLTVVHCKKEICKFLPFQFDYFDY